jgi:nucleoside-diphosphate-sugar epimerase
VKLLIAGASGNLGSHLSQHFMNGSHELRLLVHRSSLPFNIEGYENVSCWRADLARPDTLEGVCTGIDCVVHLAGVLFAPLPERFLPKTNVDYVRNLVEAAKKAGVRKFILVSFPHVEGETTPDHPAIGRMDANSNVIHFRTRLEAERQLLEACKDSSTTPVIFRSGIVYGREIKMVQTARWLLRHRLMAVWRKPTWAHLIALPDFLLALRAAIEGENVRGIYQVCDDAPLTLQDFLDRLADHYKYPRPYRLPAWMFHLAGFSVEMAALALRTDAPLNRDIVKAGMTSCVANNSRMKRELLPVLKYPSLQGGISLL